MICKIALKYRIIIIMSYFLYKKKQLVIICKSIIYECIFFAFINILSF